jgi:hypothetical protein
MVSLRAMPSVELFRRSHFALRGSAGGGVDILSVTPTSSVLPEADLGGSSTRVDPILTAGLTAQFALAPDVVVLLSALSDFDVASRHYVVEEHGQRGDVLSPWNIRPTLLAGLSFSAFGEAPFAARARR